MKFFGDKVPGKKIKAIALFVLLLIFAGKPDILCNGEATAATQGKKAGKKPNLDVGYQPTPYEVVTKMLNMADVGSDDIVYDLGCGDGRIVIMAAKERGASGIGVDLDPVRIKESQENAAKAGVTDRVSFLRQDLFKTDIKKATVVMLYLWPEVNIRLRPKLFRDLQPGTRVLSHNHNMGEWQPDEVAKVGKHTIYFWLIPANFAGNWIWNMPKGSGATNASLRISQEFQNIRGSLTVDKTTVPLTAVKLRGNNLSMSAGPVIDKQKWTIKLEGKAEGGELLGTIKISAGKTQSATPWTAKRSPGK